MSVGALSWGGLFAVWVAARLIYLAAAGGVPRLMFDEVWFLGKASRLVEGGWGHLTAQHGPVVYLGLAALLKAGAGLWASRIFGLFWDALLVFGGAALVGRVVGTEHGRAWGLLAATSPAVALVGQHGLTENAAAAGLLAGTVGMASGSWGFAWAGWLLVGLSKPGIGAAVIAACAVYAAWSAKQYGWRAAVAPLVAVAAGVGASMWLSRLFWPAASLFSVGIYGPVAIRQVAEAGLSHYFEMLWWLGGAPLAWWAISSLRSANRPYFPGLRRLHVASVCVASAVFLVVTFYGAVGPAYVALAVPILALLAAMRGGVVRPAVIALLAVQLALAGLYERSQTFGWRRIGDYLKALPVESVGTLSHDEDHAAAFEAVVRYVAGKKWSGVMGRIGESQMSSADPIQVAVADDVSPAEARALAMSSGREVALVPLYASNGLRHIVIAGRRAADVESALRSVPTPAPGNTALPGERVSRIQADYLFHNYVLNPLFRLAQSGRWLATEEDVPVVARFGPR